MSKFKVVVGTRPEVIKMAPVVRELRRRGEETRLVCSGQHREMSAQALDSFDLQADRDLDVMCENQQLAQLTAVLIDRISGELREFRPATVLVQGDTTTVLAGALAAYYQRIPLGHVEAGLRSHDDEAPWPEEMNRRLTDSISRWCFAPTSQARENLLRESIDPTRIHVTGNTVIDALLWMREKVEGAPPNLPAGLRSFVDGHRVILVTGHRRESFGPRFEQLCQAMLELAQDHPEIGLVYPVHLNPNVQEPVHRILGKHPRIRLVEPLDYAAFVWLMGRSRIVLTDSGGVQEEAPALGKPVVVMRETSERPEGVEAGNARVVGTDSQAIYDDVHGLLDSAETYRERAQVSLPYGDGHAATRIVDILLGPGGSQ